MLVIRIYLTLLTLLFLLSAVVIRGIGVLEATVILASLLFLILDTREELKDLRLLEARVSSLYK